MIRFLRNIRRTLITENKMGKYFKYAIGEILLVMIGILLALQVNNWNETKQKRKVELKLLQELMDDLFETKEDLLTDIEKANSTLQITDSLYQLTHKEGKHSIRVSMDYIFENPLLFLNSVLINQFNHMV